MLHELFILIYFKCCAERMDTSISADSNKLCDVAQTSFSYPVNGIPSQGIVVKDSNERRLQVRKCPAVDLYMNDTLMNLQLLHLI